MPSPDVATYLELELIEVDEAALVATALADLAEIFPEWVPREGNTEVVLLEALAMMAAEVGYAVNRLPDGLTEVLLRLFGLERDQGAPPIIDVRFNVGDTGGHTIPAGTTVRINLGDDAEPVDFVTTVALVIAPGSAFGIVSAESADPSTAANGIAAGTPLEVLDAIVYVNNAVLASAVYGGREPEDGAAFLDRGIPILSRLTTTLVRPADVEAFVSETANVTRVKVLDLFNPADVLSVPGRSPGYVTVAVATSGGGGLTTAAKAVIKAQLVNKMHAGLVVTVVDADVNTVDVDVRVLRYPGAIDADVELAVTQALTDYLNPDVWAWGGVVYINELIAIADRAAGVDIVLEVVTPADNLVLTGWAPLTLVGTITVTVDAP